MENKKKMGERGADLNRKLKLEGEVAYVVLSCGPDGWEGLIDKGGLP